jgi:hypothetical protein
MRARINATHNRLPMSYSDPNTGQRVHGSLPVLQVSEDDIRRFGSGGHVCGECKHFEPGHAAAVMASTRFAPTLVKDYDWKLEHVFLSDVNEAGLCGDTGVTLTFTMHAQCPNFRPHNGKIKRAPKASELERITVDRQEANKLQAVRIRNWRDKHSLDAIPGIPEGDE